MNTRDDFNDQTKIILRDRVGGLCSNPLCRIPTTGPHPNPHKRLSIGIAAHITAAAPGGPRYNENLTSDQRSSPENGIWLCSNCANLIDKNPDKYSIELLIDWKKQAETEQMNRLLNPNYEKSQSSIFNYNNNVIINSSTQVHDPTTVGLWLKFGESLERYHGAINYAYQNWVAVFEQKYPNINSELDDFSNTDIQELQDEIDQYYDSLYGVMLDSIFSMYNDSKTELMDSFNKICIEMSKELKDLIFQYLGCMTFQYYTDEGVGLVNNYWSMFFVTVERNYSKIVEFKNLIDALVQKEYKKTRT